MTRGAAAAPRVLPPPREAGLISTLAFRMHGGPSPPGPPRWPGLFGMRLTLTLVLGNRCLARAAQSWGRWHGSGPGPRPGRQGPLGRLPAPSTRPQRLRGAERLQERAATPRPRPALLTARSTDAPASSPRHHDPHSPVPARPQPSLGWVGPLGESRDLSEPRLPHP